MSIIKPVQRIKARKVTIKASKRIAEKRTYPKNGARMSTAQYVAAYYDANATIWGCTSGAAVYDSLFKGVNNG